MKRKSFKFKFWLFFGIFMTIATSIVLADYTGPNPSLRIRPVTQQDCHTENPITSCYYTAQAIGGGTCTVGSSAPSCPQPAAYFWNSCNGGGISGGTDLHVTRTPTEVCKDIQVDHQYGNATVSGNINCTSINGWCTGAANVSISGSEPIPGETITKIEGSGFSSNGSSYTHTVNANGTTTVNFWAVSSVGDTSAQGSQIVKIDISAPNASVIAPSSTQWLSGVTSVTDTSSDNESGIDSVTVSFSGAYTGACSSPGCTASVPSTVSGSVGWTINAVDKVGLTNSSSGSFSIDNTPPVVESCTYSPPDGNNGWFTSIPTIISTGSDAHSGLASEVASLSSSQGIGVSATCTVTDNVGLTSSSVVGSFNIDTEPPIGAIVEPVANSIIRSKTQFNGNITDNLSGVEKVSLMINGTVISSNTPSGTSWILDFNPSSYNDGQLNLQFIFTDQAGNSNTISRNIIIDNPEPVKALEPERMGISGIVDRVDFSNNYIIVKGTRYDLISGSKLVGVIEKGVTVIGFAMNYHDDTYADVIELYAQMDEINISGFVTDKTASTVTIDGKVFDITSSSNIPSGLAIGDEVVGKAQPSWFTKNDAIITLSIVPHIPTSTPTYTQVSVPTTDEVEPSKKSITQTPAPTEDPYLYISLDDTEYKFLKSDYEDYELGLITLEELLGIESPNISEQRDDNFGTIISWSLSVLVLLGLILLIVFGFGSVVGKVDLSTPKKNSMMLILEDENSREFMYGKKFAILIPTLNNLNAKVWYFFNRVIKIEKL